MANIGKKRIRKEKVKENKKNKKEGKRAKKSCLVLYCDVRVVYVLKYFCNVYKWIIEFFRAVLIRFKLRKKYVFVS